MTAANRWVPITDIFGSAVPPDVAVLLREAVQRLTQQGAVTYATRWRALELMAADVIAGP